MRAALVRVGVDQAFGQWNGPVDPTTNGFVYVSIPESVVFRPGLETPYGALVPTLREFLESRETAKPGQVLLPEGLVKRNMHLDPDFARLTYGDNGLRRGKGIGGFAAGDLLVFYAGLRPCRPCAHRLVYAIIGLYRISEVVRAKDVERERWVENAHTRRREPRPDDVIVRAGSGSGRLQRCLPIGEWRSGAYRVRKDLLKAWGDLSCKDGFIQRSAVPPTFVDPERFLKWFDDQRPELIPENNPPVAPQESDTIIVMLRRPRKNDRRTDPLFEFGSFGLTGCHRTNLLADTEAAGKRLAFAQGGPSGFRLVMLTPPVSVRVHSHRREVRWTPAQMPLRYELGPLLIDNAGRTDVPELSDQLEGVNRGTPEAKFASAFRSRKSPVPRELAASLRLAWARAVRNPRARAQAYWEALPRRPDEVDTDRRRTHRRLLRGAAGGRC